MDKYEPGSHSGRAVGWCPQAEGFWEDPSKDWFPSLKPFSKKRTSSPKIVVSRPTEPDASHHFSLHQKGSQLSFPSPIRAPA